jgi:ammonium transporter Rh
MSGFHLGRAPLLYIISQIIVILFFGLFTKYGHGGDPKDSNEMKVATKLLNTHYAQFQDIHIMIFVGFGFLMCFLKSHNWSSIGYNYLIAAWAI